MTPHLDKRISIRLNQFEKQRLKDLATQHHLTQSNYLRQQMGLPIQATPNQRPKGSH